MDHIENLITTLQRSAGKPWLLAFMWRPLDTQHPDVFTLLVCVCVCVCVCVLINGGRHFFCNTVVKMSICLLASLKVQVVAIVKVKAEF